MEPPPTRTTLFPYTTLFRSLTEPAERDAPRSSRMGLDDSRLVEAGEPGDLGQVGAVVAHGDLHRLPGQLPGATRGSRQRCHPPSNRVQGRAGLQDQQDRPRRRHHVEHAVEVLRAHGGRQPEHGVEIVELDEQGCVAERPHLHENARTATPAFANPVRTARAISTAPGESPCTQADSASTATTLPSIAVTTPSATRRSTRAVTSSGSCSTAPGCVRGTSVPSAV